MGEGLKKMKNLQVLDLDLTRNKIGHMADSMRYLGDGLGEIIELKSLDLNLSINFIG